MEETVDDVVILSNGKLVLQCSLDQVRTERGTLEDAFLELTS
jgi:ABC-type Na+ transport system ATPase subunit NatA